MFVVFFYSTILVDHARHNFLFFAMRQCLLLKILTSGDNIFLEENEINWHNGNICIMAENEN